MTFIILTALYLVGHRSFPILDYNLLAGKYVWFVIWVHILVPWIVLLLFRECAFSTARVQHKKNKKTKNNKKPVIKIICLYCHRKKFNNILFFSFACSFFLQQIGIVLISSLLASFYKCSKSHVDTFSDSIFG